MKHIKRIIHGILLVPILMISLLIAFELFGMCVNHAATYRQTAKLKTHLQEAIPDIKIIKSSSVTGNTSGTGNHVDCVSEVLFLSDLPYEEIQTRMADHYEYDEWMCYIEKTEEGYLFYLNTSAPFADNIEGH